MWALAVVLDHVPVSSVARILGVAWHTAHTAVAELGRELLIGHPTRLDGVQVIGVDEHCWRHTGFAKDRFVTVTVDLTPVRDRSGPARLLDMVEGRSSSVFQSWLDALPRDLPHHRSGGRDGWLHRLGRCGGYADVVVRCRVLGGGGSRRVRHNRGERRGGRLPSNLGKEAQHGPCCGRWSEAKFCR